MDKVKKFVVLPVGIFILNFVLSFHRNPWRFFMFPLDFWQKLGYFFLNLCGCSAYIFLIALLFVFVFTKSNAAELLKKPALKAMGIVFVGELLIKLLLTDIIQPLLNRPTYEAAKHGIEINEWYSVMVNGLLPDIVSFAVVYFTLRLLIKPLNLYFSFHRIWFFLGLFVCVAVSTLENYGLLQLTKNLKVSADMTLVTIQTFNVTLGWNLFSNAFTVVGVIIIVLLDIMIFSYINHCTKQDTIESIVEVESPPTDE